MHSDSPTRPARGSDMASYLHRTLLLRQSAANRQCPTCGRKSALVRDPELRLTYCRWQGSTSKSGDALCNYYRNWDELPSTGF